MSLNVYPNGNLFECQLNDAAISGEGKEETQVEVGATYFELDVDGCLCD